MICSETVGLKIGLGLSLACCGFGLKNLVLFTSLIDPLATVMLLY